MVISLAHRAWRVVISGWRPVGWEVLSCHLASAWRACEGLMELELLLQQTTVLMESSLEQLWGVFPHTSFDMEESTAKGGKVKWLVPLN